MGVHSECISSTVAIDAKQVDKALKTLKRQVLDMSFMRDINIELCHSLPEALDKLGFECELTKTGVNKIQFVGGKGDNSSLIWPILAPYVKEGSEIIMEHDGEREITIFTDGECYTQCDDEEDYQDEEEDDEPSDAVYDLLEKLEQDELNEQDIRSHVTTHGVAGPVDYSGNSLLMVLLEKYCEYDQDDTSQEQTLDSEISNLVQVLLDVKIDLNKVNDESETALYIALRGTYLELAKTLIEHGAKLAPKGSASLFDMAAEYLNLNALEFLLEHDVDFSKHGKTTLITACTADHDNPAKLPFVRHLIDELNADVNAASKKKIYAWHGELSKRATPLIAAAYADDFSLLELLIDKGADTSTPDAAGNTALHYCSGQTWPSGDGSVCWRAGKDNLSVVKLLSADASTIGVRNNVGKTPYMLAREDNLPALEWFRAQLTASGRQVPVELTADLEGTVSYSSDTGLGYALSFKQGKLHGQQKFFTKNGAPFVELTYVEGLAHGAYNAWYEDGQPMLEASLQQGKWHDEVKLFHPSGLLIKHLSYLEGRRHGTQFIFQEDGEPMIEAHYKQGKKHGRFNFTKPDGEVVVDEIFVEGVAESSAEETDTEKPKGLLSALFGSISKASVAAELVEDKLAPSEKLFFHDPKKVLAIFEKTQAQLCC
ncbi:ankyrin repeat domain-containing protein [Arenicella xantha]|uniref:MORN repeat protein n=1 Tax=Arenicella xantha TaxID=644221 RepID=A0A395JMJ2_9GAMM|nr:ankyrin repeat domain-containing protein [Arenicella xantha]RBP51057.1 MORN repeat protein [Arenicella xantha]